MVWWHISQKEIFKIFRTSVTELELASSKTRGGSEGGKMLGWFESREGLEGGMKPPPPRIFQHLLPKFPKLSKHNNGVWTVEKFTPPPNHPPLNLVSRGWGVKKIRRASRAIFMDDLNITPSSSRIFSKSALNKNIDPTMARKMGTRAS